MNLQDILTERLTDGASDAAAGILRDMVTEIFDSRAIASTGQAEPLPQYLTVDPLNKELKSLRVFVLRWGRLWHKIDEAVKDAAIEAGEKVVEEMIAHPGPLEPAIVVGVPAAKAGLKVLYELFKLATTPEPLTDLDAAIVFALFNPGENGKNKKMEKGALLRRIEPAHATPEAKAAWEQKEKPAWTQAVEDSLKKLERFDVVARWQEEYVLIDEVKITFKSA